MGALCQNCRERPAVWAMQFIAEETPTYSRLGSHYRGFRVTKLCDECKRSGEMDAVSALSTVVGGDAGKPLEG